MKENTLNRTITEDYVSFETARLLKEKGFSEECNTYFISDNEIAALPITRDFNNHGIYLSAPTLQMAMKWLREVHNINIEIHYNRFGENYKYLIIHKPEVLDDIRSLGVYYHFEDAVEAAIKDCLTIHSHIMI